MLSSYLVVVYGTYSYLSISYFSSSLAERFTDGL